MDAIDNDPRPRDLDVGMVLSPAETGRLAGVFSGAHLTLDLDEIQRDLPVDQRLASRLHGTSILLLRRQQQAEAAIDRLDVPVRLDPAETATALGLLDQAAARLDEFATRRAEGDFLVGPQRFRDQATAARAWRADLDHRQAERAVPCRDQRGEVGDER